MKTTRNVLLPLILGLLLYVSAYALLVWNGYIERSVFGVRYNRKGMHDTVVKFFGPISEIDLRWNYDRPRRKRLTGHWVSEKPGDFITISGHNQCSLHVDEFEYSGSVKFSRLDWGYVATFAHEEKDIRFSVRRIVACRAINHLKDMVLAEFPETGPDAEEYTSWRRFRLVRALLPNAP